MKGEVLIVNPMTKKSSICSRKRKARDRTHWLKPRDVSDGNAAEDMRIYVVLRQLWVCRPCSQSCGVGDRPRGHVQSVWCDFISNDPSRRARAFAGVRHDWQHQSCALESPSGLRLAAWSTVALTIAHNCNLSSNRFAYPILRRTGLFKRLAALQWTFRWVASTIVSRRGLQASHESSANMPRRSIWVHTANRLPLVARQRSVVSVGMVSNGKSKLVGATRLGLSHFGRFGGPPCVWHSLYNYPLRERRPKTIATIHHPDRQSQLARCNADDTA